MHQIKGIFQIRTRLFVCALIIYSIALSAHVSAASVLTGIDVLKRDNFKTLVGRNVGLITNQTGIDRSGNSTIQLLHDSTGVKLMAVFSPEHGLFGKLDIEDIADSKESGTGVQVFSLYGATRVPTSEMLAGIDTLVFDIQDIGTRFYTFISTMGEAMQAAANHDVRFVVLDRPNPINGLTVSGPVLDDGLQSFVGFHLLPIRHGMTVGELALMINSELQLGLELEIIELEGWKRSDYFDVTGLKWVNPSPNMRNLTEAILYPGIGLLETTNVSVGRGTDTPFELFGAPWLDGEQLARHLNHLKLPGVDFTAITFTPDASKFEGELCSGVSISITDRGQFNSVRTGLEIALLLRKYWIDSWQTERYIRLLGNQAVLDGILSQRPVAEIESIYANRLKGFLQRRSAFLIYK